MNTYFVRPVYGNCWQTALGQHITKELDGTNWPRSKPTARTCLGSTINEKRTRRSATKRTEKASGISEQARGTYKSCLFGFALAAASRTFGKRPQDEPSCTAYESYVAFTRLREVERPERRMSFKMEHVTLFTEKTCKLVDMRDCMC